MPKKMPAKAARRVNSTTDSSRGDVGAIIRSLLSKVEGRVAQGSEGGAGCRCRHPLLRARPQLHDPPGGLSELGAAGAGADLEEDAAGIVQRGEGDARHQLAVLGAAPGRGARQEPPLVADGPGVRL